MTAPTDDARQLAEDWLVEQAVAGLYPVTVDSLARLLDLVAVSVAEEAQEPR